MDYQSFFSMLYFIDGITIIDTSGTILFNINFRPDKNAEVFDSREITGRRLSEVFPNIVRENSTLFEAMEKGIPVFKNRQTITTLKGGRFETMNVSVPIRIHGRIVGAIELSRYLGENGHDTDREVSLPEDIFRRMGLNHSRLENDRAFYELSDIITSDPAMDALKDRVERFSDSSSPVFIYGETGTGKELFAHAIHTVGKRRKKPFIVQNCAAIPDTLLESILFGTAKGSFTGAVESPGLFEAAEGGTIFLDEIDSMPIHLQAKLLRVLQDGSVRRLGGGAEKRVDVRIITAASDSPEECLKKKSLRRDIFYRLCVLAMHIPPLRERRNDIEILLHYFITRYNPILHKSIRAVSKSVLDQFMEYPWPGNVRELEHIVEYALHMAGPRETTLQYEHVADRFRNLEAVMKSGCGKSGGRREFEVAGKPGDRGEFRENGESRGVGVNGFTDMKEEVKKLEIRMMRETLDGVDWNYTRAAQLLGISRQSLQYKLKQYELSR